MVVKEDLIFRQVLTLRDGARVLLRPLVPDDRQALLDFFLPLSPEERRYMRHNVNDPAQVASWAEKVDYAKILPVIALIGDRIVGIATLHFGEGPARHRAEVRIYISKEVKHRGLGSRLTLAIIDLAKKRSIHLLEVQIVSDMVEVIKAFQKVGFEPLCTFEEYFMLPDGELRDVVQLILRLRRVEDEF
jgi:L-amino acid N-acyltransferase YncA